MSRRPLVAAAALVALLGAAGLAAAAPPSEAGWSPASYAGAGQDLALAADDRLLAFATEDPGSDPGDQDLHFLTSDGGPLASQDDSGDILTDTEGKDHVVVSDDGSTVAAAVDTDGSSGTNLYLFTRPDVDNGTTSDTETLTLPVKGLDLTPDGSSLAVATADDDSGAVRLYDITDAGEFETNPTIEHEPEGPVHDVAVSEDGRWVFAGGEIAANGTGNALLYDREADTQPADQSYIEGDASQVVREVAISPDASLAVAGTAPGDLASYARAGSALTSPDATALNGSQTSGVQVDAGGTLVAASTTEGVHLLDVSGGAPNLEVRWSAPTPAPVESLAASRNLTHVVAAVSGGQGGIFAYHASTSDPIWTLPDGASHVSMDADPGVVAAARGSNVTAYPLERSVDAGFLRSDGSLADEPARTPTLEAEESTVVEVAVRNQGSVADTYRLDASIAGSWNVSVQDPTVEVLPGQTREVAVTLEVGNVASGEYNVTFTATSVADDTVAANASIPVLVSGEAAIRLDVGGLNSTRPVSPGDRPTAFFTATNLGNKETSLSVITRITPSGSPQWTVDAPDRVGPLGPGEKTSFQITVNVPADASDGTIRDVNLTVRSDAGSTGKTIRYVVNPFRDVSLDIQPQTRFVNETIRGHYNVTVSNEGSVETEFTFIIDREASGAPAPTWTVLLDRNVIVEAGESRTLPMQIVSPTNGKIDDRVLVNVQVTPRDLRGELEPAIEDNTTVSAVFKDLSEDEDEAPIDIDEIPGPGIGAVLAAALAAARRRKGDDGRDAGETCTARTSETYKNKQAATGHNPSTGPRVAGRSPPGDTP